MSVMILDAGNSIIKGKTATREVAFPHAAKALTETEYEQILTRAGRAGPPADYLRVNGQPYVTGESAERHDALTRRSGASRYRSDYYGVFVAAALARLYERGGDVMVFGSHPPRDWLPARPGQPARGAGARGARALAGAGVQHQAHSDRGARPAGDERAGTPAA